MKEKWRISFIKKIIDLNEKIVFERKLRSYYSNCGLFKTVFDVGANKGQTIDFFLKMNPSCEIYAFEPNPDLFNLLIEKYGKNENIKIYNIGISDSNGEKLFFENVFDYTSSFEELNYDSKYLEKKTKVLGVKKEELVTKKYMVSTDTLAGFIKSNGIQKKIDVLKIDTEGHELSCLKGFFNAVSGVEVGYIQLERHNDDMYLNQVGFAEIERLLNENGFSQCKKIRHGFGDFDEVIYKKGK